MKETHSKKKLKEIYSDYITINSPMEINLDYETKASIARRFEKAEEEEEESVDFSIYDAAFDELLEIIKTDLFPGFLKSINDTSL